MNSRSARIRGKIRRGMHKRVQQTCVPEELVDSWWEERSLDVPLRKIRRSTRLNVLSGTPRHQLFGDVFALARVRQVRHVRVRLPVPVRDVRVRARRRRVRHPGRGHQPDGFALGHRPLGDGLRPVLGRQRAETVVQFHPGRQPDRLEVGLHARQVRRGRARRVGHLSVHAIRLEQDGRLTLSLFVVVTRVHTRAKDASYGIQISNAKPSNVRPIEEHTGTLFFG